MPDTWICDMTHYLDECGRVVDAMPGPARRLVDHLGAIVASVTAQAEDPIGPIGVRCRRRPGRRACPGEICAMMDDETNIVWECPACGDNGLIHHWQDTPWDARRSG